MIHGDNLQYEIFIMPYFAIRYTNIDNPYLSGKHRFFMSEKNGSHLWFLSENTINEICDLETMAYTYP